jgi:deoxyuridine 5''-triphosphate nucleotidohydrolase (dut)
MKIQIKKLKEDARLPSRGSEYAAGYDLYACLDYDVEIAPHRCEKIGTGLSVAVPENYFGAVFARSGLASKQGLRPANCVGVCDSDYRGEYIVALHNDSDEIRTVRNGDRIAQLVIIPFMPADFEVTDELPETSRGEGGFGSTGR